MATHKGSDGLVKVGSSTVAEVTGFSFDETADTIETTALANSARSIGKGSRVSTMEPLHRLIRNFDLMLEKETGSKQGPTTVSRRLFQRFNKQRDKIDPDGIIKDITSLENSIIWSHPDGREGRSLDWGTVPQTIFRVRKKYNT